MTGGQSDSRPILVCLFRYSLHDHEAMANTYPHFLAGMGRSVDVHHFCSRAHGRHWVTGQPGVFLHELPIRFRRGNEFDKWMKTMLWYFVSLKAAWWARRHRARLVYIEETLPWLPSIIRVVSGCQVVISAADLFWDVYLPDRGLAGVLKRALISLDVWLWRGLHGFVTHTVAFKKYATAAGVPAERIHVVPEACEKHIFHRMSRSAARRDAAYGDDDVIVLHHGMLLPNKALDWMLGSVAPVLRSRPNVRLEFAGDGPMRRSLEVQASHLGIASQVRFHGWLPDVKQLNILLNAADVSVVIREGRFSDHFQFTANLLHSIACGSTILASRLEGISEVVVDGRNGLLFSPADSAEFRHQLERLLDDPRLRSDLADAALQTAEGRLEPRRVTAAWTAAVSDLMKAAEQT
jgi:glycosyltransferase involved in cell wall biosynthesis